MHTDAQAPRTIADALPYDGIGTRSDWLRAGASERMFADGRLRRVARGLYVAADDERPLTVRRMAALLPEGCVVGGWAAAMAHGVRDAGPTMAYGEIDDILVYPGRHMHIKPPGFRTLRSELGPHDVTRIDGVPMTTALRTAYDMARFAPTLYGAVGLVDCFLYALNPAPVDAAELQEMIDARPRARGNGRIRKAMSHSSPRARSIPESWMRTRMATDCAVLPAAMSVNATLVHDGAHFELDLVDLSTGLVLEYDGAHHAEVEQRTRDSRKNVAVDDAGLVMLRVNSPLLRAPRELAHTIRARRQSALARKGDRRVSELLAAGSLGERALRP